jgi:hypothetical protein
MDALLCALLGPLADAEDQLDEEEIAKLPLGLQYWEAQRENDPLFRQKAVHTLYQVKEGNVKMDQGKEGEGGISIHSFIKPLNAINHELSFVQRELVVKYFDEKESMPFFGNWTSREEAKNIKRRE